MIIIRCKELHYRKWALPHNRPSEWWGGIHFFHLLPWQFYSPSWNTELLSLWPNHNNLQTQDLVILCAWCFPWLLLHILPSSIISLYLQFTTMQLSTLCLIITIRFLALQKDCKSIENTDVLNDLLSWHNFQWIFGECLKPSWILVPFKNEQSIFPTYVMILMSPLSQCSLSKIYFYNQNMCHTGLFKSWVSNTVT